MSKNRNKKRKSMPVLYKAYAVILDDESCHVLMGTEKQLKASKEPYVQNGYLYMQLIGCNTDHHRLKTFVSEWTLDANNPITNRRQVVAG